MKINQLAVVLFFVPCTILAADVPNIVEGAGEYDSEMCVQQYANDCITTECLTSEDRDCQEQCQKDAADKCKEMQEE